MLAQKEREKYEAVWSSEAYRAANQRSNERRARADVIADHLKSVGAKSVVDLGIGAGHLAQALIDRGFDVEGVDIARNCLDYPIATTFLPLWDPVVGTLGRYDAVVCIDVLEHIPEHMVTRVLTNIERLAPHGYLVIALREEGMKFDEPLHLTVEPAEWWDERIRFANVEQNLSGTHAIARY